MSDAPATTEFCPFVHLHVHTTYSLLDGATQVKPLVKRAKELGMRACAITDHGNLYGLKAFYDTCRKEGLKPLLGCEAYISDEDHTVKDKDNHTQHHLILIAKNLTGYRNLLKLLSIANIEGYYYRPRIDKALLEKYHDGLICSSACIAGPIPRLILEGRMDDAEQEILWYKNLFGDDFYLEIMYHKAAPGVPTDREPGEDPVHVLEARANAAILSFGKKLGIKVIATNDVHFLREEDAEAHDILLCLGTGKKVTDEKRLRYTRQEWFKSYEEMCANLPDNLEEIHNTVEIADKVEEYVLDSDPILPVFPIPESFGKEEDYQKRFTEEMLREEFGNRFEKLAKQGLPKLIRIKFESDYLNHLTWEGAKERWPEGIPDDVKERITFELDTIKTMGFPGYFLIVRDYIASARAMGVSVGPGRGSAAGAVVAYCLKITNVDPMKYDLLFERFLNPDRISMPDIDVDFDDDGRGRVLEWVTQKYGVDHVSHIVTFGQMAPKSAIKDVCRVLDIPLPASNYLASLVPSTPKATFASIKKTVAGLPPQKEMKSDDTGQMLVRLINTPQDIVIDGSDTCPPDEWEARKKKKEGPQDASAQKDAGPATDTSAAMDDDDDDAPDEGFGDGGQPVASSSGVSVADLKRSVTMRLHGNEYEVVPAATVAKILELAQRLDGTLRQPGVHACGVIISRDPLIETIPVMPTEGESLLTTQYDGHFVEPIGLLKMDFLGLKTLSVIKECLENIKEDYGIDLDIDAIPLDDKKSYDLFTRGETTGLFQFESAGMKKYLRELKPTRLEDLVAMNALFRPGPMQYIPQFINRKHGREPIIYDHPLMEKYLSTTYGVCVYQEQVMLLSRLLGGFTRGQSDTLRKAMGKKQLETMEKLKVEFVKGCLANPDFRAYPPCASEEGAIKLINKIWDDWKAFASYAFNKSHAVCYAYVAYQTGFLKAHYKAEFMCAQIDSEFGNFDKLPGLVAEAKDQGLELLPPDVNFSLSRFSPGDNAIRFGLGGIKGVGSIAGEAIVKERKEHGLFKGYMDFFERMDPAVLNRRTVEALIYSGAFDSFGLNRATMFGEKDSKEKTGIDFASARVRARQEEKAMGQFNFFEALNVDSSNGELSDRDLPRLPEWPTKAKAEHEKEVLGIHLTDPLGRYQAYIHDLSTKSLPYMLAYKGEGSVELRVCGLASSVVNKITKTKQEPMAIVTLEAGNEKMEAVLFPRAYAFGSNVAALQEGQPLMACGELQLREGKPAFYVNEIFHLSEAIRLFTETAIIIVPYADDETQIAQLNSLAKIISAHKGKSRLTLWITNDKGEHVVIEADSAFSVKLNFQVIDEIEKLLGQNTVRLSPKDDIYAVYTPQRRYFKKG